MAASQHARARNALINAVNYHHTVISSTLCGKTINYHTRKTATTTAAPLPLLLLRLPAAPAAAAVKLPFFLCLAPKYRSNILFDSVPFSEKRDLHLFRPLCTCNGPARARPRRTDLHLFIRMFMAAFPTHFSSRSRVISLFALLVAAGTRIIQALERNT